MKSTNDPLHLDKKDQINEECSEAITETEHLVFGFPESNSDVGCSETILEINEECSEASTETEHLVLGFPESNSDVGCSETILEENIEWDYVIINPKCEIIGNGRDKCIHSQHYGWIFHVGLRQPWPRSCKSLRLYQVCKSKHFITYQSGENKILQESVFFDPEFLSNLIFVGYVVDNGPDYEENILFCCQIGGNEYRKTGCLQFFDQPWDEYPLAHQKYEKYPLTEISKEQDFLLGLVSVEQGRERPLLCWKLRETFAYRREKADDKIEENIEYNIEGPVEVDVSEFPFGQLKLPSANDRQFVLQFPNPSLGIKQKPVTVPKVLPENCNKEKELFKQKIRDLNNFMFYK